MINVGISRHHNSSVTFLKNGNIVFNIENERLSRIKYDGFPFSALFKIKDFTDYIDNLCIAGLTRLSSNIEHGFSEDVFTTFLLHLNKSFLRSQWYTHDLGLHHHRMHAASAFYNSGFKEAICIVSDGNGSDYYFNNNTFCGREHTSVFSCNYPAKFELLEKIVYFLPPEPFNIDQFSTEKIKINDSCSPAAAFEMTSKAFGLNPLDAGKIMGMSSYGKEDSTLPPIYKNGKMNFESYLNMKLNDNFWLEVIWKKYGLSENFPKVAKTTIRFQAYSEWRRERKN